MLAHREVTSMMKLHSQQLTSFERIKQKCFQQQKKVQKKMKLTQQKLKNEKILKKHQKVQEKQATRMQKKLKSSKI